MMDALGTGMHQLLDSALALKVGASCACRSPLP